MRKIYLILFAILFISISQKTYSQSLKDYFIYEEDSAVDISGFLNSDVGFLPLPIIITEPALGFGGGLGLVYFHTKKGGEKKAPGDFPPIMSMLAGAYTSNGTYALLLGHQGSYNEDRVRYTGAIGLINVNLKYYDYGFEEIKDKIGYEFNLNGFILFQEAIFRLNREIPLFLGFNYVYVNNKVTFNTGLDLPELGLDKLEGQNNLGGLNLVNIYDVRDNNFTPTKGFYTATEFGVFSKYLGGSNDYWNFENRSYAYLPVGDKFYSGYRLNIASKWGEVPFYEKPFINLRGIPLMRYQNNNVGVIETEWRYQFLNRWSLVAFGGVGYAIDYYLKIAKNDVKGAGGLGFRYFLAKDYGIHAGIDVARGPEQWAWYLTLGSNWFR